MAIQFSKAEFILSAANPEQFLRDGLPQLVFAGRSNVGKSSVINRLLGRKNLAKVGASPGKTSQINYFMVDHQLYFVDLPGYGYAKVSKAEKDRWGRLMEAYFHNTGLVSIGIQIIDARHKPTADDVTMSRYFQETGCPLLIIANKIDKVKKSQIDDNLGLIRVTLQHQGLLIPFSAETGQGKEETLAAISEILM